MNAGTRYSNKLPRELLKWIQSLDLAYSIKNVKRDFANGFLVAEILSRYFDKDISMHSFDNGIGSKIKIDNWDQLIKFFKRIPGLEDIISLEGSKAIIHSENGAAVQFLNNLYSRLTQREVQEVHPRLPAEDIPPYAKPTSSAIIREEMQQKSEFREITDTNEIKRKVQDISDTHEESLQLDRSIDPDRYSNINTGSLNSKILRGSTRTVDDEAPTTKSQVVVKEVQVKSLSDKNLANIRAAREAGMGPASSKNYSNSDFDKNIDKRLPAAKRKAIDLLNEYVCRKLADNSEVLQSLEQRQNAFEKVIEMINAGGYFDDEECIDILSGIVDASGALADVIFDYPKDFCKISGLINSVLSDHPDDSTIFTATVNSFTNLGSQCVEKDPSAASVLFTDFALPKLSQTLNTCPSKRHGILSVIFSFCSRDILSHIQMIKRLREAISENCTFIHALSIAVFMESEMDDTLLDLYHYYCCIGLENSSEKLRAACIGMLVALIPFNLSVVLDLLPKLIHYSSPYSWWEVKAQLLILSSAILNFQSDQQEKNKVDAEIIDSNSIDTALALVRREFQPNASLTIRHLGLSHLAACLKNYQELVSLFLDVLISLPFADLKLFLLKSSDNSTHDDSRLLLEICGRKYTLINITASWDSVGIARQLYFEHCQVDQTQTNDKVYRIFTIITGCFEALAFSTNQMEKEQLMDLYEDLKHYVATGIAYNIDVCMLVLRILSAVAFHSPMSVDILHNDEIRRNIASCCSSNVEDLKQAAIANFLKDLCTSNYQYAHDVKDLLQEFSQNKSMFEGSLYEVIFQEMNDV